MNIPNKDHYAVITESSVTIPGDERSRTNPGHGYPETTETYTRYESFTDRSKWEARINQLTLRQKTFRAIEAKVARIETSVSVKIGGV